MSTDTELRDPITREQPDASGDPVVAGSRGSRRRDVLIVVIAVLAGMGLVAGFGALTGSDDDAPSASIDADTDFASTPLSKRDGTVSAGTPAATPADAVEQFLTAEAAGDFERSYSMLSEAQRIDYGSPAAWTNAHADFFPVTDFQVVETTGDRTATEVRYRSSLDEVIGLVPARARVDWVAVEEDGGWLVDFDAAGVQPRYPDDDEAVDAVDTWASTLQRCGEPEQYSGALVATADLRRLVDGLCDSPSPVAVTGPAGALDEFDASGVVSAFGTEALSWARTVKVSGPVEVAVVVAPIDDRWVVVGLLPPQ